MPVCTSMFNSQVFEVKGKYLHRIKVSDLGKQHRKVVIDFKDRQFLMSVVKDESLTECEKWKYFAEKWNDCIHGVFGSLLEKRCG